MICITQNSFCERRDCYLEKSRDQSLNRITAFPIAAATALNDLGTPSWMSGTNPASARWLEGLSARLEGANNMVFSQLVAGKPVPGITNSPDGIDRGIVRFEQGLVQGELNALQSSNPELYNQVVIDANRGLEVANFTNISPSVAAASTRLGRTPDFANRADREAIGYEAVRQANAFSCLQNRSCQAGALTRR